MKNKFNISLSKFCDMTFEVGLCLLFISSWFYAYSLKGTAGLVVVSILWIIVSIVGQGLGGMDPIETKSKEEGP